MIARIWRGKTSIENYDAYSEFLIKTAIPDYKNSIGFKSLTFLRKKTGSEANFLLITYWENIEAIKSFAGKNFEKAKYYLEDKNYLLEFDENVIHYEVFKEV